MSPLIDSNGMNTITYKVNMANYGSKDNVILNLNDISEIHAEFVNTGVGQGEIHIKVPNDFTLTDALSLGSYIGQIQTMSLI